jgi:hypothetical protein
MDHRLVLVALALSLLSGCVPQELAWLVPRATVGFALRTHEGQLAGAGFVTLVAPLERSMRTVRPFRGARASRIHLLGPAAPCRVDEACRWEGRARTGAFADLVEEDELGGMR